MVWGFFKDKISKLKPKPEKPARRPKEGAISKTEAPEEKGGKEAEAPAAEQKTREKTDEELAAEINAVSPEILAQAKTPQMRKTILDVYRSMLKDGVNVANDKEVKKWLKKHPEAMQGGEVQKVETFRRGEPKVGRNDPCLCGSGKKYKKCCGK